MKLIKSLLIVFLMTFSTNVANALTLNGKYISQSGELMFTFVNDSLYVDVFPSGCGISCFKLIKKKSLRRQVTYNAYETYLEDDKVTCREVFIKVYSKHRNLYIEYYGKDKDRIYNTNEKYHIIKYHN